MIMACSLSTRSNRMVKLRKHLWMVMLSHLLVLLAKLDFGMAVTLAVIVMSVATNLTHAVAPHYFTSYVMAINHVRILVTLNALICFPYSFWGILPIATAYPCSDRQSHIIMYIKGQNHRLDSNTHQTACSW